MKKLLLTTTLFTLLTPLSFGEANPCNLVEVRRHLMELYDELDTGYSVLDAYDFKTISFDRKNELLSCQGTFEFNDGDILEIRYTERHNSIGDVIYQFDEVE